jgi:hypothetical protein
MSNMQTPRTAHSSELNGKIYVIGGSTTSWPFRPTSTVLEYTPPGMTDVKNPFRIEYIPDKFALHQNYPNPFNPETRISYEVAKHTQVVLRIINLRGQQVRTLVNEEKSAGFYEVKWDGKNDHDQRIASGVYLQRIASGVYLCRLESREFVQTRKMVFIQ